MTEKQLSQEASAAWQDVKIKWFTSPVFGYEQQAVERARAADAQQIAALRAENEQLQQQLDEWVKAYGQQAALREEPHND